MNPENFVIRIESARSPAACVMIAALDRDLLVRYPAESIHGIDVAAFDAQGGTFAIGYVGGEPAACGALRPYGDAAEIKRMFVAPDFRRRALARRMLAFLEAEAWRQGFRRALLETGLQQPEAIGLYRSTGWERIEAFGAYVGDPLSVCFAKRLVAPG
jgi:putative acetyltransferase